MPTLTDSPQTVITAPAPGGGGPTTHAVVDWERIELDYRAGIKSLREIADGSGVSHVTISKRAKKLGWIRDLSTKIHAKADELVNKAVVNKPINAASAVSERETVEANAQSQAGVRLAHRTDIERTRRLVMGLLAELEIQSTNPELFEQIEEALSQCGPGQELTAVQRAKANDGYRKAITLASRSGTMKALVESLRVLIALERQAFGIDDLPGDDSSDKSFLEAMLNARARSVKR